MGLSVKEAEMITDIRQIPTKKDPIVTCRERIALNEDQILAPAGSIIDKKVSMEASSRGILMERIPL